MYFCIIKFNQVFILKYLCFFLTDLIKYCMKVESHCCSYRAELVPVMLCLRRPSQSQAEEDDEEERVSVKSAVSFSSPVKVKAPTQLANFSNFSRVLSFSVPQFSDRSGLTANFGLPQLLCYSGVTRTWRESPLTCCVSPTLS